MIDFYKKAALTATGLLVLAVLPLPYGYYTLLRLAVTAVSTLGVFVMINSGEQTWAVGLGLLALLFNPVVPVFLGRSTWVWVDLATAVVLSFSIRSLPPVHPTSPTE